MKLLLSKPIICSWLQGVRAWHDGGDILRHHERLSVRAPRPEVEGGEAAHGGESGKKPS